MRQANDNTVLFSSLLLDACIVPVSVPVCHLDSRQQQPLMNKQQVPHQVQQSQQNNPPRLAYQQANHHSYTGVPNQHPGMGMGPNQGPHMGPHPPGQMPPHMQQQVSAHTSSKKTSLYHFFFLTLSSSLYINKILFLSISIPNLSISTSYSSSVALILPVTLYMYTYERAESSECALFLSVWFEIIIIFF